MKKTFAILAAALFVLSFAASAFAIHAEIPAETQAVAATGATQIMLGGELRSRGWWRDNFRSGLGQDGGSSAWYDQRIRLSLNAQVSPNVQGMVQLEYNTDNRDTYIWGSTHYSTSNESVFNSKPGQGFGILEAWIQYKGSGLFGFPSGLKVGHMPLKLGYGQFFDHTKYGDDAIVFFMDPTKALHIGLLTIKLDENFFSPLAPNEGNDAAGRFDNTNDLDAYVGLLVWKWNDKNSVGLNYTYLANSDLGYDQQNASIHADGQLGGFGYKASFDYQFGKEFKDGSWASGLGLDQQKFQGWQALLAANFKLNPVNLRGMFVYGSGESSADDGKIKEFTPFMTDQQNYSFIYEYQHKTTAFNKSGLNSATPFGGHAAGYANTTLVNLGVDWQATKDTLFGLDGWYFWASKTGAWEDVMGGDVSSAAGWEIDGKFKYNVAKNLTYQIDLGYFDPGKFYEDTNPTADVKGVTALRHALSLSF